MKILKYNENMNDYLAEINHVEVKFDPFVSGIMNGENHDRVLIEKLVGKDIDLDIFQTTGGAWLLTPDGEKQLQEIIASL